MRSLAIETTRSPVDTSARATHHRGAMGLLRVALLTLLCALLIGAGCLPSLPEHHYQREVFENAIEQNPDLAHAHFALGRRVMYEGEYRDAITHFESALAAQPDLLEAQISIGRCWINLDRPSYAIEPLEQALRLTPDSPRALELLGQALLEEGRLGDAEEMLGRALEIDPDAFLALAKLGEILYVRGDLAGAAERWRRAVACDPVDPIWRGAQSDLAQLLEDLETHLRLYGR
jgi:tetratricopeptide (TPR) repeat protein